MISSTRRRLCTISRVADGYVDDVTGFTNLFEEEMAGEIISPARLAKRPKPMPICGTRCFTFREELWNCRNASGTQSFQTRKVDFYQRQTIAAEGGVITVDTKPPSRIELRDSQNHTRLLGVKNARLAHRRIRQLAHQGKSIAVRKTAHGMHRYPD